MKEFFYTILFPDSLYESFFFFISKLHEMNRLTCCFHIEYKYAKMLLKIFYIILFKIILLFDTYELILSAVTDEKDENNSR
ncbi:hypothetical protein FACS1894182_11230 [Bacteroidia bacterium]|nr:hypothetical protein FACS1894182_11230 [Bacteroidia bacterium]